MPISHTSRRLLLAGGALSMVGAAFGRIASAAEGATQTSGGPAARPLLGKAALVTGSTGGLGREAALRLAALGAHVLVHGRNRDKGAAVVEEIEARGGKADFYAADLASLAQVRELAAATARQHPTLALLINNAGIGSANGDGGKTREVSADGYELRFAVNYLSGYLLTHLLLPTLKRNAPARIVNVASLGQRPLEFDNVMLEREYDGSRAYAQSKLAQIMFTIDLAQELQGAGVTVNSLHPATYMDTGMVRDAGVRPLSTVDEGADALMYVATSPELAGQSGLFFNGQRAARPNAQAYDAAARAQLRELSERLTHEG